MFHVDIIIILATAMIHILTITITIDIDLVTINIVGNIIFWTVTKHTQIFQLLL